MPTKKLQLTAPTDTTILLTRSFSAPRRLVWEAMFTPPRMRLWMLPPPGWTLGACECDARVAGALKLTWQGADGQTAMTLRGVFTEVVPCERIVHTETMLFGADQTIGSLIEAHEFTERNGLTTMRITQTYATKEARDAALTSGMDEGMEAGFARLEELVVGAAG